MLLEEFRCEYAYVPSDLFRALMAEGVEDILKVFGLLWYLFLFERAKSWKKCWGERGLYSYPVNVYHVVLLTIKLYSCFLLNVALSLSNRSACSSSSR